MRTRSRYLLFAVVVPAMLTAALLMIYVRGAKEKQEPTSVAPAAEHALTRELERQVQQERAQRMAAEGLASAQRETLEGIIAAQNARITKEQSARRRAETAASQAARRMAALREQLAEAGASQPAPQSAPESPSPVEIVPQPSPVVPAPVAEAPAPDASLITVEEQECAAGQPCRVKVFFATDRKRVDAAHVPPRFRYLKHYFGGERELDPKVGLRLGECYVTIPRPHYQKYTGKLDYAGTYVAETSVFVKDVELAASTGDWVAALNKRIEADPAREMFVFIHGFNVTFIDAARRTAQIYYDLGFKGAPVFYSWPSGGNIWNYWADEASVEWSAGHLREFLDLLAKESRATRIHLIAHSMGNRALTHALAEIGARSAADVPAECKPPVTKFQEVVLAAPDLDTDLFLQLQAGIKSAATRVTLYASKRDRAVLASWILHRFRRLGFPSGKTPPPEVDAIDASAASSDFLGHSYYGESVLWDMKLMFEKPDLTIEKRCTLKRDAAAAYYTFLPQPKSRPPGRLKRAVKFVFRKLEPDVIGTTCPAPTAAPAGGG